MMPIMAQHQQSALDRLVEKLNAFLPELIFESKETGEDRLRAFLGKQSEVMSALVSIDLDAKGTANINLGVKLRGDPRLVHNINLTIHAK